MMCGFFWASTGIGIAAISAHAATISRLVNFDIAGIEWGKNETKCIHYKETNLLSNSNLKQDQFFIR